MDNIDIGPFRKKKYLLALFNTVSFYAVFLWANDKS